jgi:cytochrome P450
VLDLDDPEAWQDLHAAYAPAREAAAAIQGRDGSVLVLRHAEATAVLKNPAFGATDLLAIYGIDEGPVWEWWRLVMASRNPPDHTRVRATVNRSFTPRQVDRLRPRIRRLATALLERAIAEGDGTIDVIAGFADRLPSQVMAHLLAIPPDDRDEFAAWTSDIGLVFGAAVTKDAALLGHIEGVLGALYDYVGRLSAQRRAHPGDDLLSALITAETADERLGRDELAALVANLLFAGHDTTRSQLMIAFQLLATHPDQFDALRDGRTDAERAAEEILRYEPAVLGAARQPFEDAVVCGIGVPAGVPVQVSLVSASRDPRAYEHPDRFDVTRADPRPVDFGAGIHHCLGAALARAELQETLQLLAARVDSMSVRGTPRWVPYAAIRRFESLHLDVELR